MIKKSYNNWLESTTSMLEESWKFRKLSGKPFDRGFIGELLLMKRLLETYKKELLSAKDNTIIYAGSANKRWDIAMQINGRLVEFNAKATSVLYKDKPRWVRQSARIFTDIDVNKKNLKQRVSLQKDFYPHLFYIFVDVGTWLKNKTQKFYVLSDKNAKAKFGKKYYNLYHGKIRKSGSTDFWVEYEDVKNSEFKTKSKLFI